jgi:hypothetical protein
MTAQKFHRARIGFKHPCLCQEPRKEHSSIPCKPGKQRTAYPELPGPRSAVCLLLCFCVHSGASLTHHCIHLQWLQGCPHLMCPLFK